MCMVLCLRVYIHTYICKPVYAAGMLHVCLYLSQGLAIPTPPTRSDTVGGPLPFALVRGDRVMVLTSAVECAKNTAEAAGGCVWQAKMAAKCGQVVSWVDGGVHVAWPSVHMRACVCACVCMCVRVCMCVYVRVCDPGA